jgi:uncharacterized protein YodC (DUF2158 family)
MSKFKQGDVVRLKSGGPSMTVTNVEPDDCLYCIWFDRNDVPQGKSFYEAGLVVADSGFTLPDE